MRPNLSAAERLIVAADFKPGEEDSRDSIAIKVLKLGEVLRRSGSCIKINSVLRAQGYDLIFALKACGLPVFADLKLNDIPETMGIDARLLRAAQPDLVTVMCSAGIDGMRAVKDQLPDTEVLGVTVLTSLSSADSMAVFNRSPRDAAAEFASMAMEAGIDGLIASPAEIVMLRNLVGKTMTINTPGVRPDWTVVEGDDQDPDRAKTPTGAITMGADRIVVGRPITQAKDPYTAAMCTIEEIRSALA